MARNTVREAVRALAHNGLLDIRQGSGTYVAATSELAGVMQRRFADADPLHVAELRSSLESTAAGLAAQRRQEADLRQLDALLAAREAAWDSGDADAFVEADATLHLAVVAASHNDVLTALYADLGAVLRDFLRADVGTELRPEDHLDHARLVAAIRDGDTDRATAEARDHAFSCRFGDSPRNDAGLAPAPQRVRGRAGRRVGRMRLPRARAPMEGRRSPRRRWRAGRRPRARSRRWSWGTSRTAGRRRRGRPARGRTCPTPAASGGSRRRRAR